MLLYILNLPHDIRLGRLRSLISEKCGLEDIILDNLQNDGDGKRVTVGLIDEVQASMVMAKINGYFLDGKKLKVEMVSKKESSWQHPKMPYYGLPTTAPTPFTSNPNMFQPPMGPDLNASNNLPYYLTQTQTPYDYGNPSAVPPVMYPAYEQPNMQIWNQMAAYQNQAFNNQPMFPPNSQDGPNSQKRNFGALNNSSSDSVTVGKRPRFDGPNASNEIGPRRNTGEETRNCETNRSYNDRSALSFDNRDRYDSRDRGRHGDRDRFDNREHDSNGRDRRGYDSRPRGHHDNSERSRNDARDSGGRNNYGGRQDFGFGSENTRKGNAPRFDDTRTYSNDPNNSSFSKSNKFGDKSGFEPNRYQSGRRNTPNKFAQSGTNRNDAGAKKFDQTDEMLKTLLFPATQKVIQNMTKNCKLQFEQNNVSLTKLRELVKSRMRIIMQEGEGQITFVSQLYNLYREQYPATEDLDVLASLTNKALTSKKRAAKGPSSNAQATGSPANPSNRPLKLNPVPPTERLPKYPNADKNVHKQLRKKNKEEGKGDYEHPVDEKYTTAIGEEMEALRSVFIKACEPSPDEHVEKIRQEIMTGGVEKFLKFIKMHVCKRLTDNFTASLRIHFNHKGPPRDELDNFLKQYNVVSLKRNDKKNFYIATCNNSEGYDKLIAMKRYVLAGATILFKTLHLLGAPAKNAEAIVKPNSKKGKGKGKGKDVSNNAGNSQAKPLGNGQPDTNKKSQNTKKVEQESKSTQNIDIKSENTQNVEEEPKDKDNVMKEEVLTSIEVDDLEDF